MGSGRYPNFHLIAALKSPKSISKKNSISPSWFKGEFEAVDINYRQNLSSAMFTTGADRDFLSVVKPG